MSHKARRRPSWTRRRKFYNKHQTARYTLPYIKYWTVSFYDHFDSMAEKYILTMGKEELESIKYYCETVRKDYEH